MKKEGKKTARVFDWEEIRKKVQDMSRPLSDRPEDRDRVLRSRAKLLSKSPEVKQEPAGSLEVVEFNLGYENYAFETRFVREICQLTELTPVPCTPEFVLGIINLRGQILSVIDIRRFFGIPQKGLTNLNKIMILSSADMEFGVLADSIPGVSVIGAGSLEAGLPTLTGVREDYLLGVTGERVTVLDAGKFLSDRKLIVHDDAAI